MALTEDRHLRPFADTLRSIRKGKLAEELAEQIADLMLAVDDTQKSGSITLTLTMKPIKDSGAIEVIDAITLKAPKAAQPSTIVFADAAGNPVRNDPRQFEIEGLKDVSLEAEQDAALKEAK